MTAIPSFIVTHVLKVPGSMPATFWQDFAFGELLRRQHTQSYFNVILRFILLSRVASRYFPVIGFFFISLL